MTYCVRGLITVSVAELFSHRRLILYVNRKQGGCANRGRAGIQAFQFAILIIDVHSRDRHFDSLFAGFTPTEPSYLTGGGGDELLSIHRCHSPLLPDE